MTTTAVLLQALPPLSPDEYRDTEKRSMALSLNINRRQLTREQRRALVAESIKADPQLSDREHGRRTGVSDKTAGTVREELKGRAEIPHVSERTDSIGRRQPASKSKPSAPQRDTTQMKGCTPMTQEITGPAAGAPGDVPRRTGWWVVGDCVCELRVSCAAVADIARRCVT